MSHDEYGTCECYACYRRVPKPQAHKLHIEQERGRSSGSYSFGRRSVRYYSGRTYYAEKEVWLCDACYSAYLAQKASRRRRNVVAVGAVVAVGTVLLIFGASNQSSSTGQPQATRTDSQSLAPQTGQTANVLRADSLKPAIGALPPDAARVQNRLVELGYMIGPADGVWGSKSRTALRAFKVANGLTDDDRWDSAVSDLIFSVQAARAPLPIAKQQ